MLWKRRGALRPDAALRVLRHITRIATKGHREQRAAADATRREVGEPVGLDDIAIRFVLAIAEDTHRFPLQAFPRVKVVGVPDLHAIGTVAEYQGRRSGTEALLCRAE